MLSAQHLAYSYPEAGQRQQVLRDVNLQLVAGEQVALVGSSGSGKSTLLNLLGGIDQPESGEVRIAGQSLQALKEPALTLFRRQHIGFVYQQFNLIPTLTVAENVRLPLELLGLSSTEQQTRLEQWLDAVGLAHRQAAFPDQLSGGEQQRVAIARALIHQPSLLLADEPTGNLDAVNGASVLDLLFGLAEQAQQTLLVVTHSRAVAERAGRICRVQHGTLVEVERQDMTW